METYLIWQRALSPRTIFGDKMLDLTVLNVRNVVAFIEHLLSRKRPFRDKTPATHLRSFFQYLLVQGLTTTNLSLCCQSAL